MRFAILGAGFAGLAVTWYLLNYTQGSATVDLYDPEPIGGGASGLSSGLLHPFVGKRARKAWEADHCLKETHRLMTEAARAIDQPLILSKGIVRPALSDQQITDFKSCTEEHTDALWWDKKTCEAKIPGINIPENGGALYIKNGLTVDSQHYLQGLWKACMLLGTQHHQLARFPAAELEPYDVVLIAMGPQSKTIPALKDLPITPVKGQVLDLEWPSSIQPPPCSVVSQKYLVMHPDQKKCTVGATYEHSFTGPEPDQQRAEQDILPKIFEFFPALEEAKIVGCRAAFRAKSHNNLPLVGKISDKFYFFTGLGSKGMLYHAWVGKLVARTLLSQNTKYLPQDLIYRIPESDELRRQS